MRVLAILSAFLALPPGWAACTTGSSGNCEVGAGKTYSGPTAIATCLAAMSAGQTCQLFGNGAFFNESVSVPAGTPGNYNSLIANPGDSVYVFSVASVGSHAKVNGLKIQNGVTPSSPTGVSCVHVADGATDWYITNNTMMGCGLNGSNGGGLNMNRKTGITHGFIQGNTQSWMCSLPSVTPDATHGVCLVGTIDGDYILIENNDWSHVSDGFYIEGKHNVMRRNTMHDDYSVDCSGPGNNGPSSNCHIDFMQANADANSSPAQDFLIEENTIHDMLVNGGPADQNPGDHAMGLFQADVCSGLCYHAIIRFNTIYNINDGAITDDNNFSNPSYGTSVSASMSGATATFTGTFSPVPAVGLTILATACTGVTGYNDVPWVVATSSASTITATSNGVSGLGAGSACTLYIRPWTNVVSYNNTWVNMNAGDHTAGKGVNAFNHGSQFGASKNELFYLPFSVTDFNPYECGSGGINTCNTFEFGNSLGYCTTGPTCNLRSHVYGTGSFTSDVGNIQPPTGTVNNSIFVDVAGNNYALASGSPARNVGTALTTVKTSVSNSTSLVVTNPDYFQVPAPGQPIPGVQGDCIKVSSIANSAVCITAIDYVTKTLTLASPITANATDPVYVSNISDGTPVLTDNIGPDIGAVPFNGGGGGGGNTSGGGFPPILFPRNDGLH